MTRLQAALLEMVGVWIVALARRSSRAQLRVGAAPPSPTQVTVSNPTPRITERRQVVVGDIVALFEKARQAPPTTTQTHVSEPTPRTAERRQVVVDPVALFEKARQKVAAEKALAAIEGALAAQRDGGNAEQALMAIERALATRRGAGGE